MVVSLFGVEEEDELLFGDEDIHERPNLSMEQLLRTLGNNLHFLSGFYFPYLFLL